MTQVVIAGGGPAGSALGCYLSMAGIKNIIIEQANHPRPHVGESLVTATTRVLEEIDFLETMEREGFVRKYGAAWHPTQGRGTVSIEFREFPQEGIDQDYTYHVDRSKFDMLLLQHAQKLGSKVYQGIRVKEVLFDDRGCARGVRMQVEGQSVEIEAPMVVDATGRGTLLGQQLKLKEPDPLFNQFAVHAWFEDVDRVDETADFIHIYFLPIERGWAWQIPITDKITSVGVVAEKEAFKKSRHDKEKWFLDQTKTAPNFEKAMRNAKRINKFKSEADYSYGMKRLVGDGFLLVGDAARFVDPIFSSGVSVALYSSKFASERIEHAFRTGEFGEATLKPYEERVRKGTTVWYEFIRLYYKVLPLFTYFIQDKRYRKEIFRLLQGEVYDRDEVSVLDAMHERIEAIEKTEGHLLSEVLDPEIVLQ